MSINLEPIKAQLAKDIGGYICLHRDDMAGLVDEVERLRAERHLDNADLAQAYDFARDKATAKERAAVVAWLRDEMHHGWEADAIERGEHRREENEP